MVLPSWVSGARAPVLSVWWTRWEREAIWYQQQQKKDFVKSAGVQIQSAG